MSTTLEVPPTSPAYHLDNNFVTLETDQITLAPARFDIDITSTGPVDGQYMTLTWPGNTITFMVAPATGPDADKIPLKDVGETLAEYAQRVAEAIRENDLITTHFRVLYLGAVGPAERIRLEYRDAVALDMDADSGITNVTITATDGADPTTAENLSAVLKVFTAAANPNDDTLVVTLQAPFDTDTSQAVFDLRGLLPLAPALPTSNTIGGVISTTYPHGIASAAFARYYLRYAERSGTPATVAALIKSPFYYMLHGSRRANYVPGAGSLALATLQHAYLRADGANFLKPVGPQQPDWVYLFTRVPLTDCRVEVIITWDDGQVTTEEASGDTFDLNQFTLYWFSSGPAQIGLTAFTPPSGATEPVAYTWRILGNGGLGEALIASVRYRVHCVCHSWNVYLMLDNGLAGCESVQMRGRTVTTYEAQRDTARRLRWTDYNLATAPDLFHFNAEGQQLFEFNTGWHERYYIEHLRQLLLGHVWLIDTGPRRFLRLLCDTDSIRIHSDDDTLYSLTIQARAGWIDNNYHIQP